MKTQVGIIGGGPSGLMLSQLLQLQGIDSVVLERQSRDHVLSRIRAGVLESGTSSMLKLAKISEGIEAHGMVHEGIDIVFNGETCHIDVTDLTDGKIVTVYGQTEVTRDLYNARDALDGKIIHNVADVEIHDLDTVKPKISYTLDDEKRSIECDYVIGCDGFHGPSRQTIPDNVKAEYEQTYPFGWLGILSETPPVSHEVIYAYHERGFALCSMRSSNLSRYYIQVPMETDINDWSDEQFWDELKCRLPKDVADKLVTGPSIEKSIAPLRSFVCEPMQWQRLFLVGDAAHIVPPTGAKGLNLAMSDVFYMYNALLDFYKNNDDEGLKNYSNTALRRVWKCERFSWSLTKFLHHFPDDDAFTQKMKQADFNYLKNSKAAQASFSENYVGLPF